MYYIVHQSWEKFLYSIDPSGKRAVLSIVVYRLASVFGLFCPFAGYRVYNVKDTELVRPRSFSKMRIQFLDED